MRNYNDPDDDKYLDLNHQGGKTWGDSQSKRISIPVKIEKPKKLNPFLQRVVDEADRERSEEMARIGYWDDCRDCGTIASLKVEGGHECGKCGEFIEAI